MTAEAAPPRCAGVPGAMLEVGVSESRATVLGDVVTTRLSEHFLGGMTSLREKSYILCKSVAVLDLDCTRRT